MFVDRSTFNTSYRTVVEMGDTVTGLVMAYHWLMVIMALLGNGAVLLGSIKYNALHCIDRISVFLLGTNFLSSI